MKPKHCCENKWATHACNDRLTSSFSCNSPGWYHICRTSVNRFTSTSPLYCPCSCSPYDPRPRDKTFPHTAWSAFRFLHLSNNSFPFFWAWPASISSQSTILIVSTFTVSRKHYCWMSERHWKLINIAFIVAKLGNICCGRKICVRETKMFLTSGNFVSEQQNCFRNICFPRG